MKRSCLDMTHCNYEGEPSDHIWQEQLHWIMALVGQHLESFTLVDRVSAI